MLVKVHVPYALTNQELDEYLALGWFRIGQSIFTTNFLKFHEKFYSAIWLRIDLTHFQPTATQIRLAKINAQFKVKIQALKVTNKQELLFSKYRNQMPFEPAASVRNLLFSDKDPNDQIFSTYQISIYDKKKLIATGFFDLGENSTAGISCFYDPDYKKYSLGKYLMYLKMNFSKANGFQYFYPGYFAPGYRTFDYKLDLAKPLLQYLDLSTNQWYNFKDYDSSKVPLNIMQQKLEQLSLVLDKRKIRNQLKYYDFFDADMVANLNGLDLLDYPMAIFCFDWSESQDTLPLIVFNIERDEFELILCKKMYRSIFEETRTDLYNTYLLKTEDIFFSSPSAEDFAFILENSIQRH